MIDRFDPPGSAGGPCRDPCAHPVCMSMRDVAGRPCSKCGLPIGYGVDFCVRGRGYLLVHVECEGGTND